MTTHSRIIHENAEIRPAITTRLERLRRSILVLKSNSRLRRLLLIFAIINLGGQLFFKLPAQWLETDPNREVYYYYLAANRYLHGEALYRPWPDYGPYILTEHKYPYPTSRIPYPPVVPVLLSPFVKTQFYIFAWHWSMAMFACFWVYAWCLAKMATKDPTGQDLLIAGLALSMVPWSTLPIHTGIIDPILWVLFGLALITPYRGVAFAASAWVKLYALWPLLFAWRREGKRIALQGLLVFVIGLGICSLAGIHSLIDWARYFLPVISQGTFFKYNVSLAFDGLRLARLMGWHYAIGPLPPLARIYLDAMEIIGPLCFGWLSRKKKPEIQYACVTAGAVLFGPLCWTSYLPLLLAPTILILREWLDNPTEIASAPDQATPDIIAPA